MDKQRKSTTGGIQVPRVNINLDRLRADLLALAEIGRCEEDQGIYRQAFTVADMKARDWLKKRIEKEGGIARIDEAGNVTGRFNDQAKGPAILLGSHIDTVPAGGMFDGALGVLAGLECARTLQDQAIVLERPYEIVAFSDEEGRFGGMFGVQAFCGKLTPDWISTAHDVDSILLADAMRENGLDPISALNAVRPAETIHAFIELHVEQGPVLENQGATIGIVEGISGVFKWLIRLVGKAAHAGTAPMNYRSDAFMGLADFAHEIPRIIAEDGSNASRLTIGKAILKPGYPHTVPGEVEFSLVGRDMDAEVMRNLSHRCRKVLSALARRHNLCFEFDQLSWFDPRACHPEIIQTFRETAEHGGYSYKLMPSGAGHDTQFMAEVTRAGMIFVPSHNGISHAPDEWTSWNDIEAGANLLLHALCSLAEKDRP